jgi:peptidoglycan/LPS O-acetylase OafA/YrhL
MSGIFNGLSSHFLKYYRVRLSLGLRTVFFRFSGCLAPKRIGKRYLWATASGFEAQICGLRGLAVLMVICGHLVQRADRFNPSEERPALDEFVIASVSSPAAGVYLFFAISGYVIARKLRNRHPGSIHLIKFYFQRVLRIAPPYSVVLLLTWVAIVTTGLEPARANLFAVAPKSLAESLTASLTYLHGLIYGTFPRLFPPGWTLEVEMQFYVLAPLLCFIFRRATKKVGIGCASALAFGASATVSMAALRSEVANLQSTMLVYSPFFVLGLALEGVKPSNWRPTSAALSALGWPAVAAFVLLQPWVGGGAPEIAARMVLIAAMFVSLATGRGSFYSVSISPVMIRLGLLSFSLYLVHLQVLHITATATASAFGPMSLVEALVINAVIGLPVALIASSTFFALVESPAVRLGRKFAGVRARSDSDSGLSRVPGSQAALITLQKRLLIPRSDILTRPLRRVGMGVEYISASEKAAEYRADSRRKPRIRLLPWRASQRSTGPRNPGDGLPSSNLPGPTATSSPGENPLTRAR